MHGLNTVLDWAIAALCLGVLPYFLFLLAATTAALVSHARRAIGRETASSEDQPRPRFLVVVPAHDEETGIAATVRGALESDYPADRFEVLVIADNCSDRTAEVARAAGARVWERSDPIRKSKGYAIEDLIGELTASGELDALEGLVIVDADSLLERGALRAFAARLARGADWIQSYDRVGNAEASWRTRLMAYSFSLLNGVALLGQQALGLGAALRGNGMCLSTRGLRRVPWHTHGLAEDLEHSWSIRIAGGRIEFERDAVVSAVMLAEGGGASAHQRRRWEHGRGELRRKMLRPLLRSSQIGAVRKAALAVELTMPSLVPLAAVFCALSSIVGLRAAGAFARGAFAPTVLAIACQALAALGLALYAVAPFLLGLVPWRTALAALYVPYYAAWKAAVALKGRPSGWVRTARAPATVPPTSAPAPRSASASRGQIAD